MSKGVSIQEDGSGRRISNVRRILTDSQNGKVSWVPLPLTNQKFISKNGMYLATLDDLDGYSKIRVNVPGGVAGTTRPTDPLQPIEVIPNMPSMYEGSSVAGIDPITQLPLGYEVLPNGELKASSNEPRTVEKTGKYVCKLTGTQTFNYNKNEYSSQQYGLYMKLRAYVHICLVIQSNKEITISTRRYVRNGMSITFSNFFPDASGIKYENLFPEYFPDFYSGGIGYQWLPESGVIGADGSFKTFTKHSDEFIGLAPIGRGDNNQIDVLMSIFIPNRLNLKHATYIEKNLVTTQGRGQFLGYADTPFFRNDNGVNGVYCISKNKDTMTLGEFVDLRNHLDYNQDLPNIVNNMFRFTTSDILIGSTNGYFTYPISKTTRLPVSGEPQYFQQYSHRDDAKLSINVGIYYNNSVYCGESQNAPEQAFTLL